MFVAALLVNRGEIAVRIIRALRGDEHSICCNMDFSQDMIHHIERFTESYCGPASTSQSI